MIAIALQILCWDLDWCYKSPYLSIQIFHLEVVHYSSYICAEDHYVKDANGCVVLQINILNTEVVIAWILGANNNNLMCHYENT